MGCTFGCGPLRFGAATVRTTVYIDGFNLYDAIRSSGCKWLNLKTLFEPVLAAHHAITRNKYAFLSTGKRSARVLLDRHRSK